MSTATTTTVTIDTANATIIDDSAKIDSTPDVAKALAAVGMDAVKKTKVKKDKKSSMYIPVKANQATLILTSRKYQHTVDWQALVDRMLKATPFDYSSAVKITVDHLGGKNDPIAKNIRYGCTRRLLGAMAKAGLIDWQKGQSEIIWL